MQGGLLGMPFRIGNLTLPNRTVRSATHAGLAQDGMVTDRLVNTLVRLARGGIGMIVSGAAAVDPQGTIGPTQLGTWDDRFIPGLSRLVEAVHAAGDAPLIIQISHAGPHARGVKVARAPSAVNTLALQAPTRALTDPEIEEIIELHVQAARRIKTAGADGIQFHMCHGDLPSCFLSRRTNRRDDRWGGSLENRMRFSLELYRRVRKAVGPDYPLMVKMNATDFKGGWTIEEAVELARKLAEEGIDAIEVSAGTSETWLGMSRGAVPTDLIVESLGGGWLKRWFVTLYFRLTSGRFAFKEAYLLPYALAVKEAVGDVPVIAVGGFRTRSTMEQALTQGVDLIAMSRPLIREPGFPRRLLEEPGVQSRCTNCNRCIVLIGFREQPLRCYERVRSRPRQSSAYHHDEVTTD